MRTVLVALVLAVALLASSCGASRRPSAPHRATAAFHQRYSGVTFRYPSAWRRAYCAAGSTVMAPFVGLTTGGGTLGGKLNHRCWLLRPNRGGVSMAWYEGGALGQQQTPHPTQRVGDKPARSKIVRLAKAVGLQGDGFCLNSDLEYTTEVWPHPKDGFDFYLVVACLRRPNIAANLRDVRQMLSTVHFAKSTTG